MNNVVPWVERHLPALRQQKSRALAGLSAGGYSTMNIGLRHPHLFGTLEAWGGYLAPVLQDGPFAHAPPSVLAANNPTVLVRKNALPHRLWLLPASQRGHFWPATFPSAPEYAAAFLRLTQERSRLLPRPSFGRWRS